MNSIDCKQKVYQSGHVYITISSSPEEQAVSAAIASSTSHQPEIPLPFNFAEVSSDSSTDSPFSRTPALPTPPTVALQDREFEPISAHGLSQKSAVLANCEITNSREAFNEKMKKRAKVAHVVAIVFLILGFKVNWFFLAATWICWEYANAALYAQKVTTFNRKELFHGYFLWAADRIFCSWPQKHFTFNPDIHKAPA